jgi:hypothetical protein
VTGSQTISYFLVVLVFFPVLLAVVGLKEVGDEEDGEDDGLLVKTTKNK